MLDQQVLLEEGSHWIDVLKVLRRDLVGEQSQVHPGLKWASLRWVGYSGHHPFLHTHPHPHDEEPDISDSSGESDYGLSQSDEDDEALEPDTPITDHGATTHHGEESDAEDSEHGSESGDSEAEEGINDFAIADQEMVKHTEETTKSTPQCYCDQGFAWEDLKDDNGNNPSKELWKWWELWVVRQCPLGHDKGKE